MKYSIFSIATGLAALALAAQAQGTEHSKIFAALAMTKAQESSPIPTDSGVFLYDAQADDWHRTGPVIQAINSIATDPSDPERIFLACGNGIVRSMDGGETWRMTSGWRESDFTKIAVDPVDGGNVYAASVWGVSVSRDGGASWKPANKGLAEKYSRTIIVDERKPKRLLLGTADGIYQSNDGANTWKPIRTSPKLVILRIARSEADLDLWIAGTEGQGVYISRDDGKKWVRTAEALSENNIYAVAVDPFDAANMAAAGWGTGVWVSSDSGESWSKRGEGLPSQNVTSMTFDPNQSGRLWVSTFEEGTVYSDQQGDNWQSGGLMGAYVYDLGMIPVK
ncbi:BNR/Asp-box repeat domain protein [Verrucomicrobiia bacterium DG1235]|nr:BNR/Asp-box repeat domain protein [Verrucomicrobiae bacterium DG1235]